MEYKDKYIKYKEKYLKLQNFIKFGGANENKCIKYLNQSIIDQESLYYIEKILSLSYDKMIGKFIDLTTAKKGSELTEDEIRRLKLEIYNQIRRQFLIPKKYDELLRYLQEYNIMPIDIKNFNDFKLKYNNDVINEKIENDPKIFYYKKIKYINTAFINKLKENNGDRINLSMSQIKEIFLQFNDDIDNFKVILKNYSDVTLYPKINNIEDSEYNEFYKLMFTTSNPNPIYVFLKIIKDYSKYDSYFLGGSNTKFKYMMDILMPENTFEVIPFSGNMFRERKKENLDVEFQRKINDNYELYYHHNKALIDKIFNKIKNDKIVIYDYIHSGVSILTFKYLIELINNKYFHYENFEECFKNIIFIGYVGEYLINKSEFNKILLNMGEPGENINYLLLNLSIETDFAFHFYHSDEFGGFNPLIVSNICSRCTPGYDPEKWVREVSDIFFDKDDRAPNYIGCNLNKMYIMLFLLYNFKNSLDTIDQLRIERLSMFQSKTEYYLYGKEETYEGLLGLSKIVIDKKLKKLQFDVTVNENIVKDILIESLLKDSLVELKNIYKLQNLKPFLSDMDDSSKYYHQCREREIPSISTKKIPYHTFHKNIDLQMILNVIPPISNKIYSYVIDEDMNLYLSEIENVLEFRAKHYQMVKLIKKNIICAGTLKWKDENNIYYTLDSGTYLGATIPKITRGPKYESILLLFIRTYFYIYKKIYANKLNFELYLNPTNVGKSFSEISLTYNMYKNALELPTLTQEKINEYCKNDLKDRIFLQTNNNECDMLDVMNTQAEFDTFKLDQNYTSICKKKN